MDRKCKNHPDRFCYVCGNVIFPGRVAKITAFVKKMLAAKHVLRPCVIGKVKKGKVCHSQLLWCGERVKIM